MLWCIRINKICWQQNNISFIIKIVLLYWLLTYKATRNFMGYKKWTFAPYFEHCVERILTVIPLSATLGHLVNVFLKINKALRTLISFQANETSTQLCGFPAKANTRSYFNTQCHWGSRGWVDMTWPWEPLQSPLQMDLEHLTHYATDMERSTHIYERRISV